MELEGLLLQADALHANRPFFLYLEERGADVLIARCQLRRRARLSNCRRAGSVALRGALGSILQVQFTRNLLQMNPNAHQGMVTAALRSVLAQETAEEVKSRWDDLAASLAERFPKAAALMHEASGGRAGVSLLPQGPLAQDLEHQPWLSDTMLKSIAEE